MTGAIQSSWLLAGPGKSGWVGANVVPIPANDLTTELVQALIREQFPAWTDLPVRPAPRQGHDNRTFRLGAELSVRLPSAEAYAAAVLKEDRVLGLLSPYVSVELPDVVATGEPTERFPLPWSVRRWLAGDVPAEAAGIDRLRVAEQLGAFLVEIQHAPAAAGPAGGRHSFFRGCHPSVYSDEVEAALAELGDRVDRGVCQRIWREALGTTWSQEPVWFHGDLAEDNILIRNATLGAVIDFGTCGVGDPACDLVIAWTFMNPSERTAFADAVALDQDTWARARGWALWKALITLLDPLSNQSTIQARALENLLTACD